MKLKEWREKQTVERKKKVVTHVTKEDFEIIEVPMSQEVLGEQISAMLKLKRPIRPGHVSQWEAGCTPRKNFMQAIMKLTKGKVTPNDFI